MLREDLPTEISVAIVIVNYRTPALAVRCVESLRAEQVRFPNLRVVVVDGGSGDDSADQLHKNLGGRAYTDWVNVLPLPLNGGFGWANNQAILTLLGSPEAPQFIHLLNPDTEVEAGAVGELIDEMLRYPTSAAVGSQLLEMDGSLTGSAFYFPTLKGEFARGARTGLINRCLSVPAPALKPSPTSVEVDWVTGASVLLRTTALREVGLFDDGFFLYHEEIELMWRMRRAGWTIRHAPGSRVRHVGGAATGVHSRPTSEITYPRRPAYWYKSRRRFFVRARGTRVALAAALLWILGHLIWRLRWLLRATRSPSTAFELRDHLSYAFPRRADQVSGVMRTESPDRPTPMWKDLAS